jgi:hypothetical protein
MKNRFLLFFSFLLLSVGVFGQDSYGIRVRTNTETLNEAKKMANDIVKASGLRANFTLAEANVQNALAVVTKGNRYILYNPHFIEAITRATGTDWAAVSVLAHEIGHHLWRNNGKLLATELEADEFSGYVLAKMGASLDEAEAVMKILASARASATHPGRADRLRSIAAGWKTGGGILTGEEQEEEDEQEQEVRTGRTLYVDRYGRVMDESGRIVGRIRT